MQHCIQKMLWQLEGSGVGIVSRGALVNVFGDNCVYVGPAPNGDCYFWVGPGDCRSLNTELLKTAGFVLSEKIPDKGEFR